MKKLTFLFLITMITSCQDTKSENSNYQKINPKKLTPGSIVHKSLSKEQLQKIKKIHKAFTEVYPISLDETITNFKRDQNPDNEIEIWSAMKEAYEKFALKNNREDQLQKRKEAFKLVLMRSMMSEEETIRMFDLKILTKSEVDKILDSYLLSKKPIKIETH
ncbi:hypothetical protein [Aquimarina sp. MMG016]|uniref:hypothetical protein n=1 Tax=Aquimarina sp. MMG016 TaxID=2822690 RepID=UPI001B39E360|nr:hypothetical protein [Aquimarina sp. MMG016]MBQ4822378.1 hypothetical protein [Aquimarina sp. MMG016]